MSTGRSLRNHAGQRDVTPVHCRFFNIARAPVGMFFMIALRVGRNMAHALSPLNHPADT